MAIKKVKKSALNQKKGKKRWFPIHAPALFGESLLGETYVYEATEVEGKYLTANLSVITKNMRKQNANVTFKVTKIVEGKGMTEIIGYNMINAAVKRLIKRGRDKVADSFLTKTSDKKILRIKPLMITANKATKLVQSACRLEARKISREYVFSKTVEQAMDDIINGKLQKIIKDKVMKIYPIKSVDIRIARLEDHSALTITDDAIKSEPVKTRKISKEVSGEKWKETHASDSETDELDALVEETSEKKAKQLVEDEEDSSEDEDLVEDEEDSSEDEEE
jgi:ribosomal protein S3AE